MKCGWSGGAEFTGAERAQLTICPNRPAAFDDVDRRSAAEALLEPVLVFVYAASARTKANGAPLIWAMKH
jgi:hypothetical protein